MDPEEKRQCRINRRGQQLWRWGWQLTIDLQPDADDNGIEKQRAFNKKQDDAFNDKIPNPDTFFEHLFNKTGPIIGAMEDLVEHKAEGIDIDERAGIKPDLMQCDISHYLHIVLEFEGDMWQEHKGFLQDLLKESTQQE